MTILAFDKFKTASLVEQTEIFDLLFEHTDALIKHTLKDASGKFNLSEIQNYSDLIEKVRNTLLYIAQTSSCDKEQKDDLSNIIEAHPKLGVPKETQGELSVFSKSEQKNMSSSDSSDENKQILIDLNNQYEDKYEGLRFVCFVNGRNQAQIIHEIKDIINSGNTWSEECIRSINAMCDIALDRLRKVL
ncbi:hypothetical protein QEN19_003040 [Hanseniaspora menglaensis]